MADETTSHDPETGEEPAPPPANGPLRTLIITLGMALAFFIVAAQLVRLAFDSRGDITASLSETVAQSFARPDIVDRNGRLLATDVEAYSLFADPGRVVDRDEVVEKLAGVFTDLDRAALRKDLSDRSRRFVWIRRGLSPRVAQDVHNLGLPGIDFRRELRRAYPGGTLAGHLLGYVNVSNKGVTGIERYVDDVVGVESVQGATLAERPPVRLSLDIGVQHAVEAELDDAVERYKAKGAAGIVLDVTTGEVLASASSPEVDPARPGMSLELARLDKVAGSTFELGSVFKTMTIAMALDASLVTPETVFNVRESLSVGKFTIGDVHASRGPLTVAQIFERSSNVGAAMIAQQAGSQRLQDFLRRMQLLDPMKTEAGAIAAPQLPARWGDVETVTASYGHGLALAPLQFAAAAGAIVNGGNRVMPTFIKRAPDAGQAAIPLVSPATSQKMRELLRLNVTAGTGKQAEVGGYQVGGKTGTADIPGVGGYRDNAVISSFLAAFPMDRPRYLVFVLLFEPQATKETANEVLAARNATPTAGRIIARVGPLLGMLPTQAAAPGKTGVAFDASQSAKYEAR